MAALQTVDGTQLVVSPVRRPEQRCGLERLCRVHTGEVTLQNVDTAGRKRGLGRTCGRIETRTQSRVLDKRRPLCSGSPQDS